MAEGAAILAQRRKYWIFVINNPIRPWAEPPILADEWRRKPKFLVYQLEEAPTTGTPHFQGYVCFDQAIRGSTLLRMLSVNGEAPYLRARTRSHLYSKEYASKPETRVEGPWTYGDDAGIANSQGSRSDLTTIKRKLDTGASMKEITDEHFESCARYYKYFREYKRIHASPRDWEMEIIVLVGTTGSGKTRWVYDTYGKDNVYSVPEAKGSGTYWDDYDGQETVLVDEMYGKRFSHGFLLRLCDRYQFTVPVHQSAVNFSSKRIIFTSNVHPKEWYTVMYDRTMTSFYHGPLHRRMVQGDSFIAKCERYRDVELIRDEDGIAVDTRNVTKYRMKITDFKDWE